MADTSLEAAPANGRWAWRKNPLVEFFEHTARSVLTFLGIALVAILLHQIVVVMEANKMPVFMTFVLTVAAYGALIIDVLWFLADLAIRTLRLGIVAWKKLRETAVQ